MNDPNGVTRFRVEAVEKRADDHEARIRANERRLGEVNGRLDGIKRAIDRCGADSKATHDWVEKQLREAEQAEAEKRRLSATEKVAIIGAVAVVFASIIAAVASLVAAGVFG